jgi:hypothetical protein
MKITEGRVRLIGIFVLILFFGIMTKPWTALQAQAPAAVVNVAEGPVVVTSLAACYWPLLPPPTTPSVAECWVVGSTPALSGKYFSLGSSPTVWTSENTQTALTKAAVIALGIKVSVPSQPAVVGTLQ